MKKLYFLFSVLLISSASFGQTTVFQESFESTPYAGTISETCNDTSSDFFTVTDGSDIASNYEVNGYDGTYFFAAQDIDGDCSSATQTITFDDINISGYTDLTFAILLAEDDSNDGNQDWDDSDYFSVSYDIDNSGTFTTLLTADNNSQGTNAEPQVNGTTLTSQFAEFAAAISGSGSVIDIVLTFSFNSGDEDIAVDNIRLIDGYVSCDVTLGEATYTCNASTTGNSDSVTINIPYTGSDATITSVTSSTGTVGGDDPASVSDGTITITGLTEGDAWDITINGGICDGSTKSGTVAEVECLPTACFDLTGTNEFEIVQIAANDDGDNWYLNSGAYAINGYCSGCTETETDSWLVFGPLDLSSAAGTELVFNSVEGFSGSDLGIFYTNAYGGCPDASITTWTSIQTIASGNDGYYSLSIPSTGTAVYIGIQYADSDTVSSWTLSNVGIYATSCPTLGTIVASDCSSLTAIDKEISNFEMYPNPTDLGYINISSRSSSAMSVKVFDLLGKQLINKTLSNNTLDVSNLNTGVYLLKVAQDNATITKRLVIK
ncbi:hypothetical protein BWZ22_04940 [Seonamhaeicola sp. S2-3]|uniref:T9SS type A sorting domain-containing protein n=1 Tax=Seonamhaeicola sp. S2-3 TaxID=1936081 RepID=UPI000972E715|nr:T9SS type A sorting domain-containing protein [Seonamhaeicola sp. S2-3]APY10624.1 hypothetical protein BWZ22_04940 [Seonamhaeicola sp. S2-3]